VKKKSLTHADNITLNRIYTASGTQTKKTTRKDFFSRAEQVNTEIPGVNFFLALFDLEAFKRDSSKNKLELLMAVAELAIELRETDIDVPFWVGKYEEGEITLEKAHEEILQAKQRLNINKYFEKKTSEEVIAAFKDADLDVPLEEDEVERLKQDYEHIVQLNKRFKFETTDTKTLQATSRVLRALVQPDHPYVMRYIPRFIAIAREIIRRQFEIFPYNTQIIALLGLLNYPAKFKGIIAQIKTGEGKSTIIAMLAALLGFQGKQVNIITSTSFLAREAQKKYAQFYKFFGLTSTAVPDVNPTTEDFSGQIVYGEATKFEHAYLEDGLYGTGLLKRKKPDVAIVDEADTFFFEGAFVSARSAIKAFQARPWIYLIIYKFIEANSTPLYLYGTPPDWVAKIRDLLANYEQSKEHSEYMAKLTDKKIDQWIQSAIYAKHKLKEKRDYYIQPVRKTSIVGEKFDRGIVSVNWRHTGDLVKGSRWSRGIHEFLEAKHGLFIADESLTAAAIARSVHLRSYPNIFGLTGTIGTKTERKEIETVYQIGNFDVPPHKPSRQKTLDPIHVNTKDEHYAMILKDIQDRQAEERPSLIVVQTIKESDRLAAYLKEQSIEHQVFDGLQGLELVTTIKKKASNPGMVTIATNTCSRGIDIILSETVDKAGGLHVILTFGPENDRVKQQIRGRAGRQGQFGSDREILRKKDVQTKEQRERKISALSEQRCKRAEVDEFNHRYLTQFFAQLQNWRTEINDSFLETIQTEFSQHTKDFYMPPTEDTGLTESEQQLRQRFIRQLQTQLQSPKNMYSWKSWLKQYKAHLNTTIIRKWAEFYNTIDDLYHDLYQEADDVEAYKVKLNAEFATTMKELDRYLSNSPWSFRAELTKLVGIDVFMTCPTYNKANPPTLFFAMHKHLVAKLPSAETKYAERLADFSTLLYLFNNPRLTEELQAHTRKYKKYKKPLARSDYWPLCRQIIDLPLSARRRDCNQYIGYLRKLSAHYKMFKPPSSKPDVPTELEISAQVLDKLQSSSQQARL
jgi:preprotein translocase subunit SecA